MYIISLVYHWWIYSISLVDLTLIELNNRNKFGGLFELSYKKFAWLLPVMTLVRSYFL